jgi:hypothetical protein
MKEPIIINESKVLYKSGDVSFFANVSDAESYLESIDVQNNEYHAFDCDGRLLKMCVREGRVVLADGEETPGHKDVMIKVMVDYLSRIGFQEKWLNNKNFLELLKEIEKSCSIRNFF